MESKQGCINFWRQPHGVLDHKELLVTLVFRLILILLFVQIFFLSMVSFTSLFHYFLQSFLSITHHMPLEQHICESLTNLVPHH